MAKFGNQPKGLDLGVQLLHLNSLRLPGAVAAYRNGSLKYLFIVQPTAISRDYELELTYSRNGSPVVRVISPNIEVLAAGSGIVPHLYERKHPVRLCLYLPKTREWGSEMILAHTLVPWAAEWLFHFEAWLATGEWSGGGEHPQPITTKKLKNKIKIKGAKNE